MCEFAESILPEVPLATWQNMLQQGFSVMVELPEDNMKGQEFCDWVARKEQQHQEQASHQMAMSCFLGWTTANVNYCQETGDSACVEL